VGRVTDRRATVLGYDGSELSTQAHERLSQATLVAGGERHLAALGVAGGMVLGDVRAVAHAVAEYDGETVVLASGDPGLFGPVRVLRAAGVSVEVLPAVSSVALAFARAGLPWDDAVVTSAHGRDPRQAVNACKAHHKVAVLTGPGAGPAEIGAALAGHRRRLFVAEDLGTPTERCTWVTPTQAATWGPWSALSVVLSIDEERGVAPGRGWLAGRGSPGSWALPDSDFAHRDGMLTKAEVRAVVLARLGPRLGDLVWDLGAGSGSVGIECARLGAAVVAVEQGSVEHLEANAASYAVDVQVVQGRAPEVLAGLPDPDAVFVGGGGADVAEIVRACVSRGPRVVVVALAALDRLGAVQEALSPYAVNGVQLSAARLRPLGTATGLAATNPVLVVWGTRP